MAGDHVTFVYGKKIVPQVILMVFAIFLYIFQTSINLYRSCSRKTHFDSSGVKLLLLLYF